MWQLTKHKDWNNLVQEFDWIQDMQGIPQDPIYHAEGDVAIHTKMVMEEMCELEAYQNLATANQAILFAAALLHDVEKRSTTVIESDGRITSRGHAKRGALTSRSILYRLHHTPFLIKEAITKLVRYHGLPLWIFEKPDPRKTLLQASLEVNTEWLYLLAKADVLGRICNDQEELLYKLELFREFCREHDCFGKAKYFGSDLGRYIYFKKEESSPDFIPYEADAFEVILLSALPGTGKDFFIKKYYKDTPVVSIDNLRRAHKVDPKDKKQNGRMVQLAKEQAKTFLRKRKTFIWNATNITANMRKQLIDLFQTYGAKTRLVYLEVSYEKLIKQNQSREYPVPYKVLNKMIKNLEIPAVWEAPLVEYWIDSEKVSF